MSCTAYLYTRFTKLSREDCEIDFKKEKKKSCKIGRRTELKRQFGTGKQEPASRVDRNAGANTSVVAPKELYSWKYSELSENSLNYVLAV